MGAAMATARGWREAGSPGWAASGARETGASSPSGDLPDHPTNQSAEQFPARPGPWDVGVRMAEPQGREPEAECPVCWNPFNNTFHTPKVLDCCHSFCVECLAHISLVAPAQRRLLCPLCRQPTVLASGQPVTDLPTDTAMLTLLRLEPHHVILEGRQLCLKDQPKSRYFLRQPRVYTLDLGAEPGSQTGPPPATTPAARPRPRPIPSHYSLRECSRNPQFRIFAYLMAVILSVTLLLILSIFWTKQFLWGVG